MKIFVGVIMIYNFIFFPKDLNLHRACWLSIRSYFQINFLAFVYKCRFWLLKTLILNPFPGLAHLNRFFSYYYSYIYIYIIDSVSFLILVSMIGGGGGGEFTPSQWLWLQKIVGKRKEIDIFI